MSETRRQDMPPPGGYPPINTVRVPARTFFSGKSIIAGYFVITAIGAVVYHITRKEIFDEELEKRSAEFAIYPMLLAERDREYLKQLRKNRDEEADLMKNVEGWKVGTFYGEPLYKMQPDDYWHEPSYHEYYVHTHYKHFAKRALMEMMC